MLLGMNRTRLARDVAMTMMKSFGRRAEELLGRSVRLHVESENTSSRVRVVLSVRAYESFTRPCEYHRYYGSMSPREEDILEDQKLVFSRLLRLPHMVRDMIPGGHIRKCACSGIPMRAGRIRRRRPMR